MAADGVEVAAALELEVAELEVAELKVAELEVAGEADCEVAVAVALVDA